MEKSKFPVSTGLGMDAETKMEKRTTKLENTNKDEDTKN